MGTSATDNKRGAQRDPKSHGNGRLAPVVLLHESGGIAFERDSGAQGKGGTQCMAMLEPVEAIKHRVQETWTPSQHSRLPAMGPTRQTPREMNTGRLIRN